MFGDWKFYLFILGVVNALITSIAFLTIKFNDLRHLAIDVEKIEKRVNDIDRKVTELDKSFAVQGEKVSKLEKLVS